MRGSFDFFWEQANTDVNSAGLRLEAAKVLSRVVFTYGVDAVRDAGLKLGQNLPVGLAMSHFHLFDPKTGVAIRGADW